MRRLAAAAIVLAFVAVAVTPATGRETEVPPSFPNGDFERDGDLDGVPDAWAVEGTTTARALRSAGLRHGGLHSLAIVDQDASGRARVTSQPVSVPAGASYTFSIYARADGTASVTNAPLNVTLIVGGGATTWVARVPVPALGASWVPVRMDFIVPLGSSTVQLVIETSATGRGLYHLDSAALADQPAPAGGLLGNPSFELAAASTAKPAFWSEECYFQSTLALATPGRTGATSLLAHAVKGTTCAAVSHPFAVPARGSVDAEVYTNAEGYFRAEVRFHAADGTVIATGTGPLWLEYPVPEWIEMPFTGCVPSSAAYATVRLGAHSNTGLARRYDDARAVADPALCNVVRFGDFEEHGATGWWTSASCGNSGPTTTSPGRTGQYALLAQDSATGPACKLAYGAHVAPGDVVTASAWARATGGGAHVALVFRDSWDSEVLRVEAPTASTGAWERVTVTATAPAAYAWVDVELRTPGTGTGVVAWDDVGLAYGTLPVT